MPYGSHHFIMYKNTESVGHTPETLILAYYNSKNFKKKSSWIGTWKINPLVIHYKESVNQNK